MGTENKKKSTKSHTTVYFPKAEAYLLRAIKIRGEQLFGKSSHGKASAYIMKLIRKDLKDQGLLEFDPESKKLVPNEEKMNKIETEIAKKYEETLADL